jgi:hypothetical protein
VWFWNELGSGKIGFRVIYATGSHGVLPDGEGVWEDAGKNLR